MSQQDSNSPSGKLPTGWKVKESKSHGRNYYINIYTNQTQWERPTKPAEKEIKVRVAHILIKHKESRNPSSWRSDQITRSKERAIEKLKHIREDIMQSADKQEKFFEIAQTESDCSSAKRSGDLGLFGKGKMQKPFEKAAFSLKIGEISDIVSTDSGVHILLRLE